MKKRSVAITLGGFLALFFLAVVIYTVFRPVGPPIAEVRSYFDSVPTTLGWSIYGHSDWEQRWSDVINKQPMKERLLRYLTFRGLPQDSGSYEFKDGDHYVSAIAEFRGESVEQIKIYGGWTPNSQAHELRADLVRRFPNLKVDVLPWGH